MDDLDYRRAIGRIERFAALFGVSGLVLAALLFDWRHAAGFGAGSLLAFLSFALIKRVANGISPGGGERQSARSSAVGLTLRYAIIGVTVFGIMRITGIGAWPVFAGLMTTVAAVIAEIVYELVTA